MTRTYGWVPDRVDRRDHKYTAQRAEAGAPLPAHVDLRPGCPPVYDQGQLGSCTGNAVAGALEFDYRRQGLPLGTPSRLFIYWNERYLEGTTATDSGAQIRDGIKAVANWGDCPETEWPYDPSRFAVQPPATCYFEAAKHLALSYQSVTQDLDQFRSCLAEGFPIVFGFVVYRSFESSQVAATGLVPMPHWFERSMGGHAVMAVGYDDASSTFLVRNSWGEQWGDGGYFHFPYDYALSTQASDFWTIKVAG